MYCRFLAYPFNASTCHYWQVFCCSGGHDYTLLPARTQATGCHLKVLWQATGLGVGLDELDQGGDRVTGAFLGGVTVGALLVE